MRTLPYKNKRSSRVATDLVPFQKGIFYSNQVQDPDCVRMIVNYDLVDNGKALRTRKGVSVESTSFSVDITPGENLWNPARASVAHYSGPLNVELPSGGADVVDVVLGLGTPEIEIFGDAAGQEANEALQQICWTNLDGLEFSFGGVAREYSGVAGWAYVQNRKGQKGFPALANIVGVKGREIVTGELRPVSTILDGSIHLIGTKVKPTQTLNDGIYSWSNPVLKILRLEGSQSADPLNLDVSFTAVDIVPHTPSASEALTTGFNMLLDDPYEFNNTQGTIDAKHIIPYAVGTPEDPYGDIKFTANTGELVRYALIYGFTTGQTHKVRWDYQTPSSPANEWQVLQDFTTVTVGLTAKVYIDYASPDPIFTLRATIRNDDDAATERVITLPYVLNSEAYKGLNSSTVYDLTTAKGMFTHQGMLGLYGVEGFEHGIFFSEVGNPGYFPYPGNVEWVEGSILNVINYLDTLLIITSNTIYVMSGQGLLATYKTTSLITNLNIKPVDALNVKVIKDQVFFKSGGKYYVLKPNAYTNDAADLRNYEISSPIQEILDNFDSVADEVLTRLYGTDYTEEEV
jgi:hypothetical protein